MRLGNTTLKKFNPDKPILTNFKLGGWTGVVIFKDKVTGKMIVNRTSSLARYLKGINFTSIKEGKYGVDVSKMSFAFMEVYYHEVQNLTMIRDVQNYLRREITKSKKTKTPQDSFDFDKKTKKKILKGEEVQVEECFIQAKVQLKELDNEDGRWISVVYRDKYNRRCTLFACAGTPNAAEQLVKMINATVKVVETNIVRLDRMTLEEFQSKHKLTMTVRERSPNDLGSRWRPELRFFASFNNCNVVEKSCICGVSGDGATEQDAIRNYGKNISEKTIRVDSLINIGKDFKVPVIID
jgi:hypothetical protein